MELPRQAFYLFGMGPQRQKLLYRDGVLYDLFTGEVLQRWDVASESILPDEYSVSIQTTDRDAVNIYEDEEGVWLHEESYPQPLTSAPVQLPRFDDEWHGAMLRALHQEILVNILPAGPLPNLLVYDRPCYAGAAAVCMCLEKTGNLGLVRDWALGLDQPFDSVCGNAEPDNLGQALYIISLFADAGHPLVAAVLGALDEFRRDDYITGMTNGDEHPVYQTKWLKFGLRSLGLEDTFQVPPLYDSYSALFWMDYKESYVRGPSVGSHAGELRPYLAWAEAHFHGWDPPEWAQRDGYPLTWECEATGAHYERMAVVNSEHVERRIAAPHSWQAAEMFLYLTA